MILLMAGWDINLRSSGGQNSLRMPLFFRTDIVSVCHGRKVMWSATENTLIMDTVCSGDWALGFIIIPLAPLRCFIPAGGRGPDRPPLHLCGGQSGYE